MALAVLSGFVLAAVAPWLSGRLGRASGWALALLPLGLAGFFARFVPEIAAGGVVSETVSWVPSLRVTFSFYLDGLSLVFALLITGIGALIVVYSGAYLAGHHHLGRFFAFLLMFMASMLGLVLADNVLTLFVFWELTSLGSYLLIGFDHERAAARAAALQALLVTGLGGLALLAGLLLLGLIGGSLELSVLLGRGDAVRAHAMYLPVLLLVLAGAFTKSAQAPFHFWLPNAMEAPTPVSAYLHAATMVKAGVYLLARLQPVLGGTDAWTVLLGGFGTATMLIGAVLAYLHSDLKRVLAYSTVSALGLLTMLVGIGSAQAIEAAAVFLLAHALYKGALFLVAGALDHEIGVRDAEQLRGLRRAMPATALAAALAALSMAGVPPLLGFLGKELLYTATLASSPVLLAASVAASALFVAIAGVAGVRPFAGATAPTPRPPHEGPVGLWLGPLLLGAIGLACGLAPALAAALITPMTSAVAGRPLEVKLALWHGVNPALGLSVVTMAAGIGVYGGRRAIRQWVKPVAAVARWGPARWYEAALDGLNALAGAQTRVLQSGYLRYYLLTIMLALIGLGWVTLAGRNPLPAMAARTDARLHEAVLAVMMLLGAIAAARAGSRLAAVAALGVSGYSLGLLYFLFGAPDLAITQFLVETLVVVLFVLVFYHLPPFARLSGPGARVRDVTVAAMVGGLMTALVLAAGAVRRGSAVSSYFLEHSVPLAHGRNIVNNILVDFRGLDTLGEITVLGVAGIGVYVLLRLRHRAGSEP